MARKEQQQATLSALRHGALALTRAQIEALAGVEVPDRTLRRWLSDWTDEGVLERSGTGRATRYRYAPQPGVAEPSLPEPLGFLRGLDDDLRQSLLGAIRDVWTHTSTALEGNTLTLGDTHFLLEEGLTVDGKPLGEHEEVVGHARATDLLYKSLRAPLNENIVFELHKAVQTERVTDIDKPSGAWKVRPNGTHARSPEGRPVFVEFAAPADVPALMSGIIDFANAIDIDAVTATTAHEFYARLHVGITQVHPFWDGNGRIARLLANVPLLKAGLPPLTIAAGRRREYIDILSRYSIAAGQVNAASGAWPVQADLAEFTRFCGECYAEIRNLVSDAFEVQARRVTSS
jgi:Fic family protein